MENIIFEIPGKENDELGIPFRFHVTEEINAYIVWKSNRDGDDREYNVQRVFRKHERYIAIIFAVGTARGVIL